MEKGKHKREKSDCVVCGKEFDRSASYMPEHRETTCSGKCRLIEWAEREQKKMESKK